MTDGLLVIGGGPAGASAAIAAARAGHQVRLVERTAAPSEPVCGQFLGPDATIALARLGLHPADLGAVPIDRLTLAHGRTQARVRLPFTGWSLPRSVLDAALLEKAATAGATISRGRAVRAVARDGEAWRVRLDDGAELQARQVVLASGKHGLRGFARPAGGSVGVKLHLRLAAPLDATVLLPGSGFYAGLQPGPDGLANLCAAFAHTPPRDAADFLARVAAASALGARLLAGAVPAQARPGAIGGVPYGWMFAGPEDGVFRIGDQFAVVPSFCGDGVAMALTAGLALADGLATGPAAFHAALRRRLARPMRWAAPTAALFAHAPGLLVRAAALLPGGVRRVAAGARVRLVG